MKCPLCNEKAMKVGMWWVCARCFRKWKVNPAAVALGSLGGKASAKKLTAKQRKERATNAVRAREAKRSQTNPTTI